ncbi:hypothetical protein [Acinetobacter sp. NigerLNRRAM0016]
MKKIVILCSIFLSTLSWATTKESEKESACNLYDQIAEKVMTYRQTGAPMSAMYGKDFGTPDRNKLVRGMLEEAYKSPKYQSEQVKQNEVNEFRNRKFLECIRLYK